MALATISQVNPAQQPTWTNNRGETMYCFDVVLSDGHTGQVNAKTADRWKVGDEVEYTSQPGRYANKLSMQKPQFGGGQQAAPASSPQREDATTGIIASWAVQCAMNACSMDPQAQGYDQEVMRLARLALEARTTLKPDVKP